MRPSRPRRPFARALGIGASAAWVVFVGEQSAGAAGGSITYLAALEVAARAAPEVAVARANEEIARAETGVAGVLPNPSISAGTSTQTARISVGASVPLVILGQRAAAIDAERARFATARVETELAAGDVRAAAAHAFVALWLAQATASEREGAAAVADRLDDAVRERVDLGASASVDGLRAHAERLRADADVQAARQLVFAAAAGLARWLGTSDETIRAAGDPDVPEKPPALADLRARIDAGPAVRRERAEARAAESRADRERVLVRPTIVADIGIDAFDYSLCPGAGGCGNPPVNYRGLLTVEVPIANQRGAYVDRELAAAGAAHARETAERTRLAASLVAAYRKFEAWTASTRALREGVVPAAAAASSATEESYTLGRAPLVAVLDAEKARIDARLTLVDACAQRADAWIEVEHALGVP